MLIHCFIFSDTTPLWEYTSPLSLSDHINQLKHSFFRELHSLCCYSFLHLQCLALYMIVYEALILEKYWLLGRFLWDVLLVVAIISRCILLPYYMHIVSCCSANFTSYECRFHAPETWFYSLRNYMCCLLWITTWEGELKSVRTRQTPYSNFQYQVVFFC